MKEENKSKKWFEKITIEALGNAFATAIIAALVWAFAYFKNHKMEVLEYISGILAILFLIFLLYRLGKIYLLHMIEEKATEICDKKIKKTNDLIEQMKEEQYKINSHQSDIFSEHSKANSADFEKLLSKILLINRLLSLKIKSAGQTSIGRDNNHYPSYIFKITMNDNFTSDELVFMLRENIFDEYEKKSMISLGIVKNFTIA